MRRAALLAASLVFAVVLSDSAADVACLGVVAVTGWAGVQLVARHKSKALLAGVIAVVVGAFIVARDTRLGGLLGSTIGLSYIMFRVIHVVVDSHYDELPRPMRPAGYALYLFSGLTFLAGPIQRYQDFAAQQAGPAAWPGRADALRHGGAILTGVFQATVLATLFFLGFAATRTSVGPTGLAAACLCFAGYLYVGFLGYMRVVRGLGALMGFTLPANFNDPLASSDFLDVWSRWHITLSDWFKLYVFNPLVAWLLAASERPRLLPYLGAAGFFATFVLMGLWHGRSVRFLLYGLCLGALVSGVKLFQTMMMKRLGRAAYGRLKKAALYERCANAFSEAAFIVVLGFLWAPADRVTPHPGAWVGAFLLVAMVIAGLAALPRPRRLDPIVLRWPVLTAIAQGAAVLVQLVVLCIPAPPLVYSLF